MKKIFTIIVLVMMAVTTWAYDVEVDGIYYNLNATAKTAEVTFKGSTYFKVKSYSSSVTIPDSIVSGGIAYNVRSIGKDAFRNCSGLTSVTIPNSVTSIGCCAFYDCQYLTAVTIPNSVTNIGQGAFSNCIRLPSVIIPNSVTSINDDTFYDCFDLSSITISDSVTNIGICAFCFCLGLTSVTIPNSVTSIGNSAFLNCGNLTSVTIPNTVSNIGIYAFENCSLTSVYNYATTPQALSSSSDFSNASKCTLYVPWESVGAYKSANYWKDFKEIKYIAGTKPIVKCATPTISLVNGKVVVTSETEGATCEVTKEVKTEDDSYSLVVSAYATAEGYEQSETATATFPLNIGERGDVNGDGTINVLDVNCVIDKITTSK